MNQRLHRGGTPKGRAKDKLEVKGRLEQSLIQVSDAGIGHPCFKNLELWLDPHLQRPLGQRFQEFGSVDKNSSAKVVGDSLTRAKYSRVVLA